MAEANSSSLQSFYRVATPTIANGDIISGLPDGVLCHIMSFLPTKYAVGTSILSRRWRYTWTSIPDLDFDDTLISLSETNTQLNEQIFIQFVNRVLLLRSDRTRKLRLKVTSCLDFVWNDVNSWICAAVMHNVEELDLNFSSPRLPQSLFSCKTLKILKLQAEIHIKIIGSVSLPRLKLLILQNFGASELEKILYGSPVLEELVFNRCPNDYFSTKLHVWSPTLKRLTIHQTEMRGKLEGYIYSVVVSAPKLEFLEVKDYLSKQVEIMKLSNPVKATIDVSKSRGNQVLRFLRKISNASVLSLSANALNALFQASDNYFPMFRCLAQLEMGAIGNGWLMLPHLLKWSPNLESFTLNKEDAHGIRNDTNVPSEPVFKDEFVPNCLLTSLKSVEFKGFGGNRAEMEILDYFLKNAILLKQFSISFSTVSFQEQAEILKKLIMFPRASTTCQFLIN